MQSVNAYLQLHTHPGVGNWGVLGGRLHGLGSTAFLLPGSGRAGPREPRQSQGLVLSGEVVGHLQSALYLGRVIKRNSNQSVDSTNAVYLNGLQASQAVKQHATLDQTLACKQRDLEEFESWLLQNTSRDLASFEPADFEAFFPYWYESHGRKGNLASHSRASKLVSNIRTSISHIQRDPKSYTPGNPMDSPHIQTLIHGYCNFTKAQNLTPKAAKPWTEDHLRQLLTYLSNRSCELSGIERLCHLRDGFIFTVMWETQSRAANAGSWEKGQFFSSSGQDLWAALRAGQVPIGEKILLTPRRTKTGAKDGPMEIVAGGNHISATFWLYHLIQESDLQHFPITHFVTRPLQPSGKDFAEKPMSSSSIGQRLAKYKREGNLDISHQVHGSRRGVMQHRFYNLQHNMQDIMQRSQMRTPAIARRYLNPVAHI